MSFANPTNPVQPSTMTDARSSRTARSDSSHKDRVSLSMSEPSSRTGIPPSGATSFDHANLRGSCRAAPNSTQFIVVESKLPRAKCRYEATNLGVRQVDGARIASCYGQCERTRNESHKRLENLGRYRWRGGLEIVDYESPFGFRLLDTRK